MLNLVVIMGRLTSQPELKTTQNGVSVLPFTVAVNRQYGEQQTDFIPCVAWRNTAEFITKYFGKGQSIVIQGSLQQRDFEDKQGNKRTAYEVVVSTADFCGKKENADEQAQKLDNEVDTSEFEEISLAEQDLPF
mgnify:CR=1 FL=1